MLMPGRSFGSENSRFGFNGKENDNEIKGSGCWQDYGFRHYDPRISRFISTDPIAREYPFLSAYQFASNTPIKAIDFDGLEAVDPINGAYSLSEQTQIIQTEGTAIINTTLILSHTYNGQVTSVDYDADGPTNRITFASREILRGNWSGVSAARNGTIESMGNIFREAAVLVGKNVTGVLNPDIKTNSSEFAVEAKRQGSEGYGKIFRHIASQGIFTILYGENFSTDIGDFYERVNPNIPIDISYRDLINNEYGRKFGKSYSGNLNTPDDFANYLNAAVDYVYNTFDIKADKPIFDSTSSEVLELHKTVRGETNIGTNSNKNVKGD